MRSRLHSSVILCGNLVDKLLREGPLNEITRKIVEEELAVILQGEKDIIAFHEKQLAKWSKDYSNQLRSKLCCELSVGSSDHSWRRIKGGLYCTLSIGDPQARQPEGGLYTCPQA
jgi:hypothetical protein